MCYSIPITDQMTEEYTSKGIKTIITTESNQIKHYTELANKGKLLQYNIIETNTMGQALKVVCSLLEKGEKYAI